MIHENLAETPMFECPPPYRIELYKSGRESDWLRIHEIADEFNVFTPFVFTDQFGSNKDLLADQQFYLLDQGGEPVGTATAWTDTRGTYCGRVHWVAILPEHQGRGLAKPLLSIVCRKLLEMGHSKGCLSTSTARVAAINLYLKFGFQPLIQSDEDEVAWSTFERRQPN
jgi:GNAT superfamily N-acetyltransferase